MSARLDRTVLIAAPVFAIACACRAPLWLAALTGVAVAVFVWHVSRTP